jgi:hypothetical protein
MVRGFAHSDGWTVGSFVRSGLAIVRANREGVDEQGRPLKVEQLTENFLSCAFTRTALAMPFSRLFQPPSCSHSAFAWSAARGPPGRLRQLGG